MLFTNNLKMQNRIAMNAGREKNKSLIYEIRLLIEE
jgi:hypothetical protein